MFRQGDAVGGIQPFFLDQVDVELDGSAPLEAQAGIDVILSQAVQVAALFVDFIAGATTSLDIAIYDFRLLDGELTDRIVDAVATAVGRGVSVRLAYDLHSQDTDDPTLKAFGDAGGDPAPTGTHTFVQTVGFPARVQTRPIMEEAIDPGHQIMHQKYIVRDAGSSDAAVLMGSANFTTDAWGIQENNLLIISAAPDLAASYETDFVDLWTTGRISGTGQGDTGRLSVGPVGIAYYFAPGEGAVIETVLADLIASARQRIRVASMVLSSGPILQALVNQINAGLDVTGIYDGPQMADVSADWARGAPGGVGQQHAALWEKVKPHLQAKPSLRFSPSGPHNFMHNKVLVVDNTVVTGSFNFSGNAVRNAENVLQLDSNALADQYATYVDQLIARYVATRA